MDTRRSVDPCLVTSGVEMSVFVDVMWKLFEDLVKAALMDGCPEVARWP